MPPKKTKRNSRNEPSQSNSQVIAIQEHFSQDTDTDPVPQIIKKLEIQYKESPKSLNSNILCLFCRICGLSEMTAKLDYSDMENSLKEILQISYDNSLNSNTKNVIIVNPKDALHSKYVQRIKDFFMMLLSHDYDFIKESKENLLLLNMRQILQALSTSKLRNVRFSSIELMRILIECQTSLYSALINQKQSRKAFQFTKDVESYLKSIVKSRIKDVDSKIKDSLHQIIKSTFITMENDLVDKKLLQEIFQPSLQDQSGKIIQGALLTLIYLFQKCNKIKSILIDFAKYSFKKLEYLSIMPNRNGVLSLKFMIEVGKQQEQDAKIIKPSHIARLFEYYIIQNYNQGLFTVVQAFYSSIYASDEEIIKNRSIVIIQILNLIGNFSTKIIIQEAIIKQFLQYSKVPCQAIFNLDEVFSILIEQSYLYNGQYVQLRQPDLVNLIFITNQYVDYVKKKIEKWEGASEKFQKQKAKWKQIGQSFNNNLLTNIKVIIQEKMQNNLTKGYLRMMSSLILPISGAFESYLDYMVQKIVASFQIQSDPSILKYVVSIFYNNKSHHISLLINNISKLSKEHQNLKKIAIMSKFYYRESTNADFAEQLIKSYKYLDDQNIKIQYFTGLFLIHQWFMIQNKLYQSQAVLHYQQIQHKVLKFFFGILASNESYNLKSTIITLLCELFKTICSDRLIQSQQIYYSLGEQEMKLIFRFLNSEIGLPSSDIEQDQSSEQNDYTIMINKMSINNQNREQLIVKIFDLFRTSHIIAHNSLAMELICGALLAERQSIDANQTNISNINISISYDASNMSKSIYSKQELASNFIKSLVQGQHQQQNKNKFVFWNFFAKVAKVYANKLKTRQRLLNKCLDLYVKNKQYKKQEKSFINKVMLFIITDFDRILEEKSFEQFSNTILILKKFSKKISVEAQKRIEMFIKSKAELPEENQYFKNLLGHLQKSIKNYNKKMVKEEQKDDEQSSQAQNQRGAINQRLMMRPTNKRVTRNSIKKMQIEQ